MINVREMMRVVRIKDDEAVLEPLELEGCANCAFSSVCNVDPDKQKVVAKIDGKDVRLGDIVEVKTPKAVATKLSFVVYTVPLLIFVTLLVVFKAMGYSDELSFVLSIIPVGIYYAFLRKLDRKIAAKYKPKIISIRSRESLFKVE